MSELLENPAAESDILCPLCEYNLRGLTEARCPECGHRSTWEELRNRPPTHPYLFEHHPRRNLWSFLRTTLGSLRVIRFWRGVLPTMSIRAGRLLLFGLMVTVIGSLSVLTGISGDAVHRAQMNAVNRKYMAQAHMQMMNPAYRYYDPAQAAGLQNVIKQYGSLDEYERSDIRGPRVWPSGRTNGTRCGEATGPAGAPMTRSPFFAPR